MKQKVTREQAMLEHFGEIAVDHNNRTLMVRKVTIEGAVGYRVEGLVPIHAGADEAIAAARAELGAGFVNRLSGVALNGARTGVNLLSTGLGYIGFGLAMAGEVAQKASGLKQGRRLNG